LLCASIPPAHARGAQTFPLAFSSLTPRVDCWTIGKLSNNAFAGLRCLLFKFLRPDSTFAIPAPPRYSVSMSTAVLELKEKVEQLTSEERYELMQILEDIEDNALADKAEAEGKFIFLEDYKKLKSEKELA
jgi:hypothetical protein